MSSPKLSPSYYGYVGSTKDALLIIQAILDKQLELIPRRPHERERSNLIKSGNVFVFIEEHSGIKRWTDGIAWSPSRILGRFLVYRELDKHSLNEKDDKKKKKRKVSIDQDPLDLKHQQPSIPPAQQLLQSNLNNDESEFDKNLVGSLVTSYVFKDQGLIKKTLSVTTTAKDLHIDRKEEKQTIHLISYYNADDVLNAKLQRPSESDLKNITITNSLWNAVKDSSLGGKIPIEDEAYYFLDTNYQLQNMSLLQQPALQHQSQSQQQSQAPQPQYQAIMSQSSSQQQQVPPVIPPQYLFQQKYTPHHHIASNPQIQLPIHMLPIPLQAQPPPSFNAGHSMKDEYSQHHSASAPATATIKKEEEISNAAGNNELTFINPFTGATHHQANTNPTYNSGSGSAPTSSSGPSSTALFNNYILQQQQFPPTLQQHHQVDNSTNFQSPQQHFPPFPQHFQQMYAPQHSNNHHMGSISASSDQFSLSGNSNGSISSISSNILHGGTNSNSFSGPPSSTFNKKHYRNSSSGASAGGWFTTTLGSGPGGPSYINAPPSLSNPDFTSNNDTAVSLHHHVPTHTNMNNEDSNNPQPYVTGGYTNSS